METRGRPDAALYATILEGLWQSGSQPQRLRALKRFNAALQGNVHGLAASISGGEAAIEVKPWPQIDFCCPALILHAACLLKRPVRIGA